MVEHVLQKRMVRGSIPLGGSSWQCCSMTLPISLEEAFVASDCITHVCCFGGKTAFRQGLVTTCNYCSSCRLLQSLPSMSVVKSDNSILQRWTEQGRVNDNKLAFLWESLTLQDQVLSQTSADGLDPRSCTRDQPLNVIPLHMHLTSSIERQRNRSREIWITQTK